VRSECNIVQYKYEVQGGSNMTGTDVARFTHKQSRSYFNHLVYDHELSVEAVRYRLFAI